MEKQIKSIYDDFEDFSEDEPDLSDLDLGVIYNIDFIVWTFTGGDPGKEKAIWNMSVYKLKKYLCYSTYEKYLTTEKGKRSNQQSSNTSFE